MSAAYQMIVVDEIGPATADEVGELAETINLS